MFSLLPLTLTLPPATPLKLNVEIGSPDTFNRFTVVASGLLR